MLLGSTGCKKSSTAENGGSSAASQTATQTGGNSAAATTPAGGSGDSSGGSAAPGSSSSKPSAGRPSGTKPGEEPAPGFITDKPRPTKAATAGAELKELEIPPVRTVSGVRLPDGVKEARYAVVFEPYGWAPDGQSGKRLIIKISTAKPQDGVKLADLNKANAIVEVAPEMVGLFDRGGRFEGTIVVTAGADKRTVLRLEKAKFAK